MRQVIVNEWMSFDGVVQSAGADDDTSKALPMGLAPSLLRRGGTAMGG